jgi:regulatory protein
LAGAITRLVYQKRNKQRVNVYLDDAYAFALPDTAASQLKVGQHLTDAEIADLRQVDSEAKAFDRALRFLGNRPRSRSEVETRLEQAGYTPEIRQKVLERLQRLSYIDDRAFVAWWIENRSQFSPRSGRALSQELWQKGVARDLVEDALAGLDDDDLALAAGLSRASRWQHLSHEAFDKKMLGFLQRRGFNYVTARNVTNQIWKVSKSVDQ